MKNNILPFICLLNCFVITGINPVYAHFQVLIPNEDIVNEKTAKSVTLEILFTHPMEQSPIMEMGKPVQIGVLNDGIKRDLTNLLKVNKQADKMAYQLSFVPPHPSDYIFYIEPAPYWEAAEEKMIIHYTKVVVDAFEAETGWDAMVGFPVEIEPLVRPYGLWTGNSFRGIVKKQGKPVPFATLEVEFFNRDKQVTPPSAPFITQVIKADGQGVFSYSFPRAGWWGFAALLEGDKPLKNPEGKEVPVEEGAVMWVRAVDMH